MSFHSTAKCSLEIDGIAYTIAEHPTAPGFPYGQEGRAGTVYQLLSSTGTKALKVFKPRFSTPSLVMQANAIAPFANLPGLKVCQLNVLSPSREGSLLRQYPDLTYALLMPWIEGQTWFDVINSREEFTAKESLELAQKFTSILVGLEEHGLAHCDLSSSNLIFYKNGEGISLELIDIDGMYGPGFPKPEIVLSGSPGYAHTSIQNGSWNSQSDRFAGTVLIAEMLGWSNPEVRQAANDGCFFSAEDIQKDCSRYQLLIGYLQNTFGETVADNFAAAWHSETLNDCPTFGEWLVSIPDEVSAHTAPVTLSQPKKDKNQKETTSDAISILINAAKSLEVLGKGENALECYRQAFAIAPVESGQAKEIQQQIKYLENPEIINEESTPDINNQESKLAASETIPNIRVNQILRDAHNKQEKELMESALEVYQQALIPASGSTDIHPILAIKQEISNPENIQKGKTIPVKIKKTDSGQPMNYPEVNLSDVEELSQKDNSNKKDKSGGKALWIIFGILSIVVGVSCSSNSSGWGILLILSGVISFIIGLLN